MQIAAAAFTWLIVLLIGFLFVSRLRYGRSIGDAIQVLALVAQFVLGVLPAAGAYAGMRNEDRGLGWKLLRIVLIAVGLAVVMVVISFLA